jgi:hypothetical protein
MINSANNKNFIQKVKEKPKIFTMLLGLVGGGFVLGFLTAQLINMVQYIEKTSSLLFN